MTDILKHVQYSHIYMSIANKTHWTFLNVPKSYVFSYCHELCDHGVVHWITAELIIFYHPMSYHPFPGGKREF